VGRKKKKNSFLFFYLPLPPTTNIKKKKKKINMGEKFGRGKKVSLSPFALFIEPTF
jgi:hypothetical protein